MEKKRKPFEILCMCIGIFLCLFVFIIVGTLLLGPVIMRPNPSTDYDTYEDMKQILERNPDILIIPEEIIPDGDYVDYEVIDSSRKWHITPDEYELTVYRNGKIYFLLDSSDDFSGYHSHPFIEKEFDLDNVDLTLYIENRDLCYHFKTDTHFYFIRIDTEDAEFEANLCARLNGEA